MASGGHDHRHHPVAAHQLPQSPVPIQALLRALAGSADAAGIWTIQTGVFPENTASVRLHRQAGFRTVGTRERIGCHHGRWRDVLLLERRSKTAGTG